MHMWFQSCEFRFTCIENCSHLSKRHNAACELSQGISVPNFILKFRPCRIWNYIRLTLRMFSPEFCFWSGIHYAFSHTTWFLPVHPISCHYLGGAVTDTSILYFIRGRLRCISVRIGWIWPYFILCYVRHLSCNMGHGGRTIRPRCKLG